MANLKERLSQLEVDVAAHNLDANRHEHQMQNVNQAGGAPGAGLNRKTVIQQKGQALRDRWTAMEAEDRRQFSPGQRPDLRR